ncbi:MAG: tyrosine recombinase [Candidatus Eisenbacteria bacterium]|uniref:Tyrosine recombinase XerC n=1 Tax=Eiseniibacteriota bacterium TaxID=2212470 RepID=A0A937XAR6_UNCEI|nr:tyrosine recombinase [Candidatus Eisenbacteria bacterium]
MGGSARLPLASGVGEREADSRPRGPESGLPAPAREALEGFLFHLALVRGASPHTVSAYRGDLVSLLRHLSARGLPGPAEADEGQLRAYLIALHERGRRAAGVARARSAIKTFFAFLADEGVVREDPACDLPAPAGWRRLPRALGRDEATRLVESVAGGAALDLRDRALLECAYGTGARVSELLGLRLDDCRWEERLLRFAGKGGRIRLVPAGEPALRALLAYIDLGRPLLAARRGGAGPAPETIFLNARGGTLSRMGFWKILGRRAREAGLAERIHPHLLRHTYATHLLHGGASLRVVQELLGHARLSTTQIYTSVDEAYLQSMHRRYHPRG